MRLLVAALVGGLIVFIWSAFAHIATPLGTMGLSVLPNEAPVIDTFRNSIPKSGLYFFPSAGMDLKSKPTPEQQKAMEEAMRRGPTGLILYKAEGSGMMEPRQLVTELVTNILAAYVAAVLLSVMVAPYFARSVFVALLAVFTFLSLSASYWNWYGFPTAFVVGELVTEFVGWLLAGLAMAKIVKPPV